MTLFYHHFWPLNQSIRPKSTEKRCLLCGLWPPTHKSMSKSDQFMSFFCVFREKWLFALFENSPAHFSHFLRSGAKLKKRPFLKNGILSLFIDFYCFFMFFHDFCHFFMFIDIDLWHNLCYVVSLIYVMFTYVMCHLFML